MQMAKQCAIYNKWFCFTASFEWICYQYIDSFHDTYSPAMPLFIACVLVCDGLSYACYLFVDDFKSQKTIDIGSPTLSQFISNWDLVVWDTHASVRQFLCYFIQTITKRELSNFYSTFLSAKYCAYNFQSFKQFQVNKFEFYTKIKRREKINFS